MEKLSRFISYLTGMTPAEIVDSRAVRDVAGSLFLRIANTLLQIGVAILLARILPLKSFGLYSLVMSWVMVLVVPSMVGTIPFIQREVAVAKSREAWSQVKGLLKWSTTTVAVVSVLISLAAAICVLLLLHSDTDRTAFLIGLTTIPVLALMQLWQAQLRAWGSVVAGQLPMAIIRLFLFGSMLLVIGLVFTGIEKSASLALGIHLFVSFLAMLSAIYMKFRHVRIPRGTSPETKSWKWLRMSSGFMVLGGLFIVNNRVAILMVGNMLGKADTGLFAVAVKGSNLVVVGLMAANIALLPRIAAFFHAGNIRKLQRMITRTYRMVALITIPVVLAFVFFGNLLLGIFGPVYIAAWPALVILSIAQLLSVLSGPTSNILNMAGKERLTILGTAVSLTVNVAANLILIPLMGINGAALATLLSILTNTVLLSTICYRRLGIWTPVLGSNFKVSPGENRR